MNRRMTAHESFRRDKRAFWVIPDDSCFYADWKKMHMDLYAGKEPNSPESCMKMAVIDFNMERDTWGRVGNLIKGVLDDKINV